MQKITPYIVIVALAAGSVLLPAISFAQTAQTPVSSLAQLQAEIQSLTAEVQSLQQELMGCDAFNTDLSFGMTGAQVTALQTALQKDGEPVTINGTFDAQTESAVIAFQEKYASQILAPSGLQAGTGYVGMYTRTELNALSGCGATTTTTMPQPSPSLPILPPQPLPPPPPIVPTSTLPPVMVQTSTATTTMVAPLGNTTNRAKSPTDKLGTITLVASGFVGVEINKITVTFTGSLLNVGSSTLLNSAQLLDLNNIPVVSGDGATASVDPAAGTVTWTFGSGAGGYFIPSGAAYPFTLLVDSSAVPPLGVDIAESLTASIENPSDIQYSSGSSTGLNLPATNFPLMINSVIYVMGQ